jgi:SAM-dependent methyltransferase
MSNINNKTEKEYRDSQTGFGHLDKSLGLEDWLDLTYSTDLIRKNRYTNVVKKFLDTKNKLDVLEIAAGVGDFVCYCSKLFPQHSYSANELSDMQLGGNIETVAKYFEIQEIPKLSFEPVEVLSYEDNSFDVIFIKAAVHHFENPKKGFDEIYRVLKPDGQVIFFEDPVCLDIPIYKKWKKDNFAKEERLLGINEHIYTIKDYVSFGSIFSDTSFYIDEELVDEYDRQQKKRSGLKKILCAVIKSNEFLFKNYMIWRFSPIIFVFKK